MIETLVFVLILGGLIGVIVGVLGWLIGEARKGSSLFRDKPKHLLAITTGISTEDMFKIVLRSAPQYGYRIEDIDETSGRIILSDPPGFFSFNNVYSIYVSKRDDNQTLIEIGASGRTRRLRLFLEPHQERCYNMVKAETLIRT